MEDESPSVDPLFIGLTKPPMTIGVPLEFFGANFILTGCGFIFFLSLSAKLLFFLAFTLPFHALGYLATAKDPNWMSVLLTKLKNCPPIRNRSFWQSNSYQP